MTRLRGWLRGFFLAALALFFASIAFGEWLIRSSYASTMRDNQHWYYLKAASGVRYISSPFATAYDLSVKIGFGGLVIGIICACIASASAKAETRVDAVNQ